MAATTTTIRRARYADSLMLTQMVRESSAYGGEYRRMVETVSISPEQIARDLMYVYELVGRIAGFYSLKYDAGRAELDFLFVDNNAQGQGVGRILFQHMLGEAQRLGIAEVLIVSHPPAEAFYARMGAATIGVQPPAGRITWARPRMVVRTEG
jgi:N-acetylglutamate synthase-like GNAT family acetyltransferase